MSIRCTSDVGGGQLRDRGLLLERLARGHLGRRVVPGEARVVGAHPFGKPIIDHQGLAFLLADMAAAVESARATYLHAARLRNAGRPFSRQASIAKMTTRCG
jgi:alkylation response protein AidB-like acyl-CoA dehydrogenase